MFQFKSATLLHAIIIAAMSSLLLVDMLINPGEAATYDSRIHITNISSFHQALSDGDFPVTWADTFANYGLPMPIVSQQLTSYLGAFLTFITHNPLVSYKLLLLLAAIGSSLSLYAFLRQHTSATSALVGCVLFSFTAYRITNIYVRGALPEVFALIFVPLVLLSLHKLFHQHRYSFACLTLSATLLILTHPFVFVVSQVLFLPYLAYLYKTQPSKKSFGLTLLSYTIACGLSAYYLIPLLWEIKYFVISANQSQLVTDQFLNWRNYLLEKWPYSTSTEVFVRGNIIQFGLVETLCLILGLPWLLAQKKDSAKMLIKFFILPAVIVAVVMTTKLAFPAYRFLPLLHGIQFPWRMFSGLLFLPPLILALWLDRSKLKQVLGLIIILLILVVRMPQSYGKNYTYHPPRYYEKTIKNLHFDSMNTIWTGTTGDYPLKRVKGEVIEGEGTITARMESNSQREYSVKAISNIRMRDNTFYFPGWRVYVDGQDTSIEFQDVNHRGVITYFVPAGVHQIEVVFKDTKVRLLGKLISLSSLIVLGVTSIWLNKSLATSKHKHA